MRRYLGIDVIKISNGEKGVSTRDRITTMALLQDEAWIASHSSPLANVGR
jgi:hypothetical protein